MNILGLMTGTSMDGIDISLVETNGQDLKRINENYFHSYSNETKNYLLNILNEDLSINLQRKNILDNLITEEHYEAIKKFDLIKKSELVGFHGQTIYHNPYRRISIQLGNPQKLANMLHKNVIYDFRSQDILMGGQGAPLAPIYHQLIIKSLNLELPSCIINIGGVANLTFWDGKNLLGFDTGPGNALMDNYIKKISNNYFDKNGIMASKGVPKKKFILKHLNNKFFKKRPPKSLDKNSFKDFYDELLNNNFSTVDTMATLAEFTIESIVIALQLLPQKLKNIIVTGGGYRNNYLMSSLKQKLNINFLNEDDTNINFDFIESELIAFLTARSFYGIPYTFPSTTGTSKAISGGTIYRCL